MNSRALLLYVGLAILLAAFFWFDIRPFLSLPTGYGFGSIDFIQYWTASRLALSGQNPYDPELIYQLERTVSGFSRAEPILMWNPPWTLTFLSPFLALSFEWAVFAWAWGAITIYFWSSYVLWCAFSKSSSIVHSSVIALSLLLPIHNSLVFGQSSPLVLLGFAYFVSGILRGNFFLSGLSIPLIFVKPHGLYLVLFLVSWWVIKNRKWSFFLGALSSLSVVIAFTEGWAPGSTLFWLQSFSTPHVGSSNVLQWVVPTLTGAVRYLLESGDGKIPVWPMVVIPGVTLFFVTLCFILERENLEWKNMLPAITVLSLLSSPYGWIYDQVVILIVPIAIAAMMQAKKQSREQIFQFALFNASLYILPFYLAKSVVKYQHELFWIFLIPLGLWLFRGRLVTSR